jgi:hypothetical protein
MGPHVLTVCVLPLVPALHERLACALAEARRPAHPSLIARGVDELDEEGNQTANYGKTGAPAYVSPSWELTCAASRQVGADVGMALGALRRAVGAIVADVTEATVGPYRTMIISREAARANVGRDTAADGEVVGRVRARIAKLRAANTKAKSREAVVESISEPTQESEATSSNSVNVRSSTRAHGSLPVIGAHTTYMETMQSIEQLQQLYGDSLRSYTHYSEDPLLGVVF